MMRSMVIIDNAANSADRYDPCRACKKRRGRRDLKARAFTVFAPTNAAFDKLPAGTVETLVKPENKVTLTKVLTYHVLAKV